MKKMISTLLSLLIVLQLLTLGITDPASAKSFELNSLKDAEKGKTVSTYTSTTLSEDDIVAVSGNINANNGFVNKESLIIGEVSGSREANAKHYRHKDGTYTLAEYAQDIHFKNNDGEWEDIDNTLILKDNKLSNTNQPAYVPKASSDDVRIPQDFSNGQAVTVYKDDYEITIRPASLKKDESSIQAVIKNPSKKSIERPMRLSVEERNERYMKLDKLTATAEYAGILSGADLQYTISPGSLKENIIVNTSQNSYNYSYELQYGELRPEINADGSISFHAETDEETIFKFSAPIMYDSNGNASDNITLTLSNNILTLHADSAWINDSSRAFPVTIDPTLIYSSNGIHDCYVSSLMKNICYSDIQYAYVGTGLVGTRRTYIAIPTPTLPKGSVITNAKLTYRQYSCLYYNSNTINLYDLSGLNSWSYNTITWNSQPMPKTVNGLQSQASRIVDYTDAESSAEAQYTFDLTQLTRLWYYGTVTNNGVMLAINNESNQCQPLLYSAQGSDTGKKPCYIVKYNHCVGLENYWTFEGFNLGRSGQVNVNVYNSAITYIHEDLAMSGNHLPININHIYNNNGRRKTSAGNYYNADIFEQKYPNMDLGKYFHLNLQEVLVDATVSNYVYEYYDSDGTMHMFRQVNGDVVHEYDSSIKVTTVNSELIMTDADGNKKVFDQSGRLCRIVDPYGNTQTITITDGRITAVNDPAGRTATLTYNGDKLVSITDPAEREISFSYWATSGQLKEITYPDESTTFFGFGENDRPDMIEAYDQTCIVFGYSSAVNGDLVLSALTKYDQDFTSSPKDRLNMIFSLVNPSQVSTGQTVVTDKSGNVRSYTFDPFGRVCGITNEEMQTVYYQYGRDTESSSHTFNKLLSKSDIQNVSPNLLLDHGFEGGNAWSVLQSPNNQSYALSNTEASSGYQSFKIELNDTVGVVEAAQNFNISSGKTYSIALDLFIKDDLDSDDNDNALEISDSNGFSFGAAYYVGNEWIVERSVFIGNTEGWERFTHTFKAPTGEITSCHVFFELAYTIGEVYVDNVQVEESGGNGYYNLLENSNFSLGGSTLPSNIVQPTKWNLLLPMSDDGLHVTNGGDCYAHLTGKTDEPRSISQTVKVNAKAGQTLIIGGRASAIKAHDCELPVNDSTPFGISVNLYATTGNGVLPSECITVPFDCGIDNAIQNRVVAYRLNSNCAQIKFSFVFDYQIGSADFYDAFIYVDGFGDYYGYDNDGRLVSDTNDEGMIKSIDYEVNSNDYDVKQTVNNQDATVASVECNAANEPTSVENNIGNNIEYTYNLDGSVSEVTITYVDESNNSIETVINESFTYIQSGNYVKTYTDSDGKTTTYYYDYNEDPNVPDDPQIGLVTGIVDSKGNVCTLTYDPDTDELLSVTGNPALTAPTLLIENDPITKSYTYSDYLLTKVTRNSTDYNYVYNNRNTLSSISVGNQELIEYEYDFDLMPANYSVNKLMNVNFANDDTYSPVYDSKNNVIGDKWNNTQTAEYLYGVNGKLARLDDKITDTTYQYEYAFYDLPFRVTGTDHTNDIVTQTVYDYDRAGTLYKSGFSIDYNDVLSQRFHNNSKGSPEDVIIETSGNAYNVHYDYDELNRLKSYSYGPVIFTYSYPENGYDPDGFKIETPELPSGGYSYNYLEVPQWNTVEYLENGSNLGAAYVYDDFGRIITDNIWSWGLYYNYEYDDGGNLLARNECAALGLGFPSDEVIASDTYTYGDTNWKDRLTAYNSKPISYDDCGNPISYDGYTFTWERGGLLSSVVGNGVNITYNYDSQGRRVSKTSGNVTTKFFYSGDNLVRQTDGTNEWVFLYAAGDKPIGFEYNGTPYFYGYNVKGEIIYLFDEAGDIEVWYEYDSLGHNLFADYPVTDINPLWFRGYYYEPELDYYYDGSRYYSIEWGRFISPDLSIVTPEGSSGVANAYACGADDPVNFSFAPNSVGDISASNEIPPSPAPVQTVLEVLLSTDYSSWRPSQFASGLLGLAISGTVGHFFNQHLFPRIETITNSLHFLNNLSGTSIQQSIQQSLESETYDYKWTSAGYLFTENEYLVGLQQSLFNRGDLFQIRTYSMKDMSRLAPGGAWILDFHKVKSGLNKGNYTTLPGSYQWQHRVGYVWWYDFFFSVGGPNKALKYPFRAKDHTNHSGTSDYVVWCWMGDYWNLGAGAEIGFYYQPNQLLANMGRYEIDRNIKLKVNMNVWYGNEQITTDFYQENWWVTSFTPKIQRPDLNQLNATYEVVFADTNMDGNSNNWKTAFNSTFYATPGNQHEGLDSSMWSQPLPVVYSTRNPDFFVSFRP